jgi:hypothetical protein
MESRHLGPFSGLQLTIIICVVVVCVLFPVGAWAAVTGSNVFITDPGTGKHAGLDKGGALRTVASPSYAFSFPPKQISLVPAGNLVAPDPSKTRYAITSFTVSNGTTQVATAHLTAFASSASLTNCGFIFNTVASAAGPEVTVPPNSTVSLTFPTPFVTNAVSGKDVCLAASGNAFIPQTWSVTGYKLLP